VRVVGHSVVLTWLAVVVVDWRQLRGTYGSAAEVPVLLEAAASSTDWDAPAWQELWSQLYHQGSVAPASYAALPELARIARTRPVVAVDPALFLFASIVASTDGPPEIAGVRDRHAVAIAGLLPVAEDKLDLVRDRTEIIYALQNVAALEDLSVWHWRLEGLAGGEVEVECPACGDDIYLELPGDDSYATADPADLREGQVVRPARPTDLGPPEARLLDLCHAHGHHTVAAELLHLFGVVTCPPCGTQFSIADAST
jgi:hypothetical protein